MGVYHALRKRASHIDLEQLDDLLFRAPRDNLWVPVGGRGVFGGQILGQALHAATRTVDGTMSTPREWACHSMHAYFLQSGDPELDVIYRVRKTSQRRSFVSRSVEAVQHGATIFQCQASFAKIQASELDHEDPLMPQVPPPEECVSLNDQFRDVASKVPHPLREKLVESLSKIPVEFRLVDDLPDYLNPHPAKRPPRRRVWMKVADVDADGLQECCAAYFSDHLLLVTALLPHGLEFPSPRLGAVASLDHGLWFHAPDFRADEWMLYDVHSPRLAHSRGLAIGHMYAQKTGRLCVTSVQEGLLRLAKPSLVRSMWQLFLEARSRFWS